MRKRLDPVTTEVIGRHVLAAAEEMGVTLMRTAFSPNIKERNDFSTAVFDAKGAVVAQAEHVPIRRCHVNRHLASLWAPTPEIMQRSSLAATVSSRPPRNWRSVRRETRWRWTLKRL